MLNISYFGNRQPIVEMLKKVVKMTKKNPINSLQVIDLGGVDPPSIKFLSKNINKTSPTIVLSIRRYELNDQIGVKENFLLENLDNTIIYRLSPLDINFEFYRGWAGATGSILTALSPSGVAWVNTMDIAEALLISEDDLFSRTGKAFDLTGPRQISMAELIGHFDKQLGINIDIKCLEEDVAKKTLSENNVPEHVINWLVEYEVTATDSRLIGTTNILKQILGKSAREADFSYSS